MGIIKYIIRITYFNIYLSSVVTLLARIIDSENKNLVGDTVRKIRKEKHMSQQDVSDRLEELAIYICRGSLSRLEDKQRTVTDIELQGLAEVLGVPITSFFENIS